MAQPLEEKLNPMPNPHKSERIRGIHIIDGSTSKTSPFYYMAQKKNWIWSMQKNPPEIWHGSRTLRHEKFENSVKSRL